MSLSRGKRKRLRSSYKQLASHVEHGKRGTWHISAIYFRSDYTKSENHNKRARRRMVWGMRAKNGNLRDSNWKIDVKNTRTMTKKRKTTKQLTAKIEQKNHNGGQADGTPLEMGAEPTMLERPLRLLAPANAVTASVPFRPKTTIHRRCPCPDTFCPWS